MFDVRRFAEDHGITLTTEGHHHCAEGWIQIHCPFCTNGDEGYHLGFNTQWGNMNCWRCGSIGLTDYISEILRIPAFQARTIINQYLTGGSNIPKKIIVRPKSIKEPPMTNRMDQPHRKYLRRRGFNPFQIEKTWGLKATKFLSGEWSWRVIIPIRNQENIIVAYQGRSIRENEKPKYKMSSKEEILINPRALLYGIEKVPDNSVVIVEGVTGVWKIGPGCVATFGIDWKEEQGYILRKYKKRFVIFDPEPLAQRRAKELASWLGNFPGHTEVVDGFKTDPGDFTDKQVFSIRKNLLGFTSERKSV